MTCTEIQTLRDALMWNFFHTVYYPLIPYWSNNQYQVSFGLMNDSCS